MKIALQATGWIALASLILFNDLLKAVSYWAIMGMGEFLVWITPS